MKNKVAITIDRKKRVIMKFDDAIVIISVNKDFKGLGKVTKGLKTYLLTRDNINDFCYYDELHDDVRYAVKMTREIEDLFFMIVDNTIYHEVNGGGWIKEFH
jgi:hypothetical protein